MVSFCGLANLWLADAADRSETLLELVDATFGIHKLFLSSEERMGIGSDTCGNQGVFNTIDHFFFIRSLSRTSDEACASGHINEDDWIVFWMKILFHMKIWLSTRANARGGKTAEIPQGVKFLAGKSP